jgi:NADH dehydrogenase FAD-containing subunit
LKTNDQQADELSRLMDAGEHMRVVVLGGGFGGVATVHQLERLLRARAVVEITLVSRENFFVLTPLLFEACSGRLELRHCAQPIRAALGRARFIEASYLFQMPRWDRWLRIVLDWTVARFFRSDITRVDLRVERDQVRQASELAGTSTRC